MRRYLASLKAKYNLPDWFVKLNYVGLIPIIGWPLVFFGSIFLFDNPKSFASTSLLFILINSYPLLLIGNMHLSFRLFYTAKPTSVVLPFVPIIVLIWLMYQLNQS